MSDRMSGDSPRRLERDGSLGSEDASQEEFDFDKNSKVGAEVDLTVTLFIPVNHLLSH